MQSVVSGRTFVFLLSLCLVASTSSASSSDDRLDPSAAPATAEGTPIPARSRQLVVVRTKTWNSLTGSLQRYERSNEGAWRSAEEPTPINVGRSGMAWGRGLHPEQAAGPKKREGDGRSPAGVFSLGSAFGYAEDLPAQAKKFPYMQLQNSVYCIEDARSAHYNELVDTRSVPLKGWERKSQMLRPDGLFRWGLIVEQNDTDTVRGRGSCIFLHIWRGPKRGTAGCTAMPEEQVEKLLTWVDPSAAPVLVQLPDAEYERLRAPWQLP